MKTANLAIVFTDIKGFTERTSRQTLEENQRLLRTHNNLLSPLFKAFGGRIIKSIGDAFLVTFESPTQAVLSGMAIQDRLWQYNRGVSEAERLDVRVAINVGEVRLESNDVFGEPVNIASRVEAIAEAGEVYFTEAVYLAMNKAEVPSQEVGSFELKGIPGRIRVFHVPRAPYRVEAPIVVHLAPGSEAPPVQTQSEQPPFANLALSRIPESALVAGPDLAALGSRAATVGGRLVEYARTAFQSMKAGQSLPGGRRTLAIGGGVLAMVLGLGVVVFGDSAAENAIEAVADASSREQKKDAVEKARRLINEEKDPVERTWLNGQLAEAQGDFGRAVDHYRTAAKAQRGAAKDRLIELLSHESCSARHEAAKVVGELRLESARGELEDLAEKGGPGEDPGLFGCDSKAAAKRALERLGNE